MLWDKVRESENAFLKRKDNRSKQSLRMEYVLARKQFDKNYVKVNVNIMLKRERIYAIFRLKIIENSGLGLEN